MTIAYMALDMGSTYTKLALICPGRVPQVFERPSPPPLQADGRYEVDAEAYFQQVLDMIHRHWDEAVKGILISTQMHGYVLTDGSFRPLSPYVSWQDGMGAKHLSQIQSLLTAEDVAPAGVPLKPNLALCALLGRRFAGDALPKEAWFHTLGGYVIARLTGRHVCHMTNAAPTGMADLLCGGWNQPLIAKAGLEWLRLPRIETGLQSVGEWNGVPVYPDLGDQQVCAMGAQLEQDVCLHVNVGTAGLMGVLKRTFTTDGCESRPWVTPGLYLRTVSGLMGGRHVAALNKQLGGDNAETWRMMTHHPVQQAAQLYTDMAISYRDAARRMQAAVHKLCFSGGCAAKNPALRKAVAEAFGMALETGTVIGGVWEGMEALIRMIESPTTNVRKEVDSWK